MKSLRFNQTGTLAALTLVDDLPPPAPGPDKALVQVHYAGLNPSDVKNVLGRFPYTTLPRTPGRDFSGTVIDGPTAWVGRAVWGTGRSLGFTRDGSHAELLTLPVAGLVEKPASLTFAQAAACGVPYTTAWSALERTNVGPGTTLLVMGANGAVGQAAITLARARGARVVGAVRRKDAQFALVASGTPALLLDSAGQITEQLREHFPDGAEVILDTTGFWLEASVHALAPFGRIAVIAAPADGHARTPILSLYRRGGSIVGINSLLYDVDECAVMLASIGAIFDKEKILPPQSLETVPMENSLEAYRRVDEGMTTKMVIEMSAAHDI